MYFRLKYDNDTNKFTVVDSVLEIDLEDIDHLYATKEQLEIIDKGFVTNYYETLEKVFKKRKD